VVFWYWNFHGDTLFTARIGLCIKMTMGFWHDIIDLTLKWHFKMCTYLSQSLGVVGCTIFEDNLSAQIKKFSLDNLVITDVRSYVVVLTV
jgi:hypothetical protein